MRKNIEYPERPIAGVGVVVFRNEEVLLVKRKKSHIKDSGASLEENCGLVKL